MRKAALNTAVLVLAMSANMTAAAISGTFTFNGSVTVTQNNILWMSNTGVSDKAGIAATGLSGNFIGLGGTNLSILDLNRATEPVGAPFPEQNFMSFDAAPGLGNLMITFIALGSFSSAQCFLAPAPGQSCTLSSAQVPGGSPFMFTNTSSNGTTVDGSSATWTMRGVTADHQTTWSGVWTSQFNTSYQTVLASFFGPGGSVTNSYSASVVLPAPGIAAVPEPGTWTLLGTGLMLLCAGLARFKKS